MRHTSQYFQQPWHSVSTALISLLWRCLGSCTTAHRPCMQSPLLPCNWDYWWVWVAYQQNPSSWIVPILDTWNSSDLWFCVWFVWTDMLYQQNMWRRQRGAQGSRAPSVTIGIFCHKSLESRKSALYKRYVTMLRVTMTMTELENCFVMTDNSDAWQACYCYSSRERELRLEFEIQRTWMTSAREEFDREKERRLRQ